MASKRALLAESQGEALKFSKSFLIACWRRYLSYLGNSQVGTFGNKVNISSSSNCGIVERTQASEMEMQNGLISTL